MSTVFLRRLVLAIFCAPVLLLADTQTDSQSVSKEVRVINGAKVTIERTKDAAGKETIKMLTPKGNGRDRVKIITEDEYQRLFGKRREAK